ncbi:MAG: VanW family protein [Polyangiaceae bacterium]|nr:VanW family protein [Polyangiaceae bacterium]
MRRAILAVTVLLGAVVGGAVAALWHARCFPSAHALPGTLVGERLPPSAKPLGDWLETRRLRLLDRTAYLRLPDDTVEVRFGDLGLELDVADTLARVLEHSLGGSFWQRLRRALSARAGNEDVELTWTLDEQKARSVLERWVPSVAREPEDARLDLRAHRRVDDVPGRRMDIDRTIEELLRGPHQDARLFEVRTLEIPARVQSDDLADIDVSKVLSSYETSFRGRAGARAINIASAAAYLNGTVLQPGQTISFNAVVGPRTVERGFTPAPVIVQDELEQAVGGGVCQVASTLHAAAVYGLLDIVRRRSHSRPSGYAPLGLDATVVENEVDLRIRNPYPQTLIVQAFLPGNEILRVELLGRSPEGKVVHNYTVDKVTDFSRRVYVKPWLKRGDFVRKQKGIRGYDVTSFVSVRDGDRRTRARSYKSKYYPVPEVYWIAPDEPLDALPALPEGGSGVQVQDEDGTPATPDSTGSGASDSDRSPWRSQTPVDPPPDPYEKPG